MKLLEAMKALWLAIQNRIKVLEMNARAISLVNFCMSLKNPESRQHQPMANNLLSFTYP